MSRGLFITGTDTGVGKTVVACALLRGAAADGFRAVGMKPVASGIEGHATQNADVTALVQASNVAAPLADVNPYAFAPAIAPHVAAAQCGTRIDLDAIAAAYARLAAIADVVVVEGAGGALTPLSDRCDMLDIATRLDLSVVLVIGIRLGCLNHGFLSALAVRARGLQLAGWVANRIDPAMAEAQASIATLARGVPAPLLAEVRWCAPGEGVAPLRGVIAPPSA